MINIQSTTDTAEQVQAALGSVKADDKAEVVETKPEAAVEGVKAKAADESAEVSETPETKEVEETDEVEVEDESDESEGEEKSEDKKPKKKAGGVQKRIGKLTKDRALAEQERDYWREQALKSQKAGAEGDKKPEGKKAVVEGKPNPNDFEQHDEYVEALADWKVEQKIKAKEVESQANAAKKALEDQRNKLFERNKAFAEKHKDFLEVVENLEGLPSSATMDEVVMSSSVGSEMLYELGKDRAECERILGLGAIAQAKELGKIEARILAAQKSADVSTEEKKTTKAPPPIKPVGAKSTSGASKSIYDPDISQAEFEKLRAAQIKERQRANL